MEVIQMMESLLIVNGLGIVFVITLQLYNTLQIHKLKEVYAMTTAEVLAAIDAANAATTEIASDIDKLIELVANNPNVPTDVADAVTALKGRIVDTAAKFDAGA